MTSNMYKASSFPNDAQANFNVLFFFFFLVSMIELSCFLFWF